MADNIRPASQEDILRWPDGTWCFRCELYWMSHMSDDYEVITEAHPEYDLIIEGVM
jgi:hypothetical protein